jgi:hypothetical protein
MIIRKPGNLGNLQAKHADAIYRSTTQRNKVAKWRAWNRWEVSEIAGFPDDHGRTP